jgi:hypothetical protein
MLIELVTPLMLATAPITIDVPESKYDHAAQVSVHKNLKLAMTINGTQTYNATGKPFDNDND